MDDGDRKLFTESLQHATGQHTGAALDAALEELGWHDALEDDRRDAVAILFELQGAANVTSSASQWGDGGSARTGSCHDGRIAPHRPDASAPGRVEGEHLVVHGLAASSLEKSAEAAIAYGTHDVYLTAVASWQLEVHPAPGLDPALGLVEVRGEIPFIPSASRPAADAWAEAVAAGQIALAHELVGVSRAMLRLAREHALERVQFGRPIAGFQAIRHRLAESLVAIEGAQACADAAWDDASPLSAALAKAVAGGSARTVAKHAQQVLGGMGYTTEHPLHRYVRRTLVLDELLGAGRSLTREIGAQLISARGLPEMLPL